MNIDVTHHTEPERRHEATISLNYTIRADTSQRLRTRIFAALNELTDAIAAAEPYETHPSPIRTSPPLATWDRSRVRAQLEEASGQDLSVTDALPDSLIATAQALGLQPHELGVWMYDTPHRWEVSDLTAWAQRNGFGTAPATTEAGNAR